LKASGNREDSEIAKPVARRVADQASNTGSPKCYKNDVWSQILAVATIAGNKLRFPSAWTASEGRGCLERPSAASCSPRGRFRLGGNESFFRPIALVKTVFLDRGDPTAPCRDPTMPGRPSDQRLKHDPVSRRPVSPERCATACDWLHPPDSMRFPPL
jgi:hypothetical protein